MRTVKDAIELMTLLHDGQIDKAGAPYIQHPLRVMEDLRQQGYPDWVLQTGVAHDALEDCSITSFDMQQMGYHPDVVGAVIALTRWPHQKPYEYYRYLNTHEVWRAIKLADIKDNTDPVRLGKLPVGTRNRLVVKYKEGLKELNSPWLHPHVPF